MLMCPDLHIDFMAVDIDFKGIYPQHTLARTVAMIERTTQHCLGPGDDFGGVERLDNVVVGTDTQPWFVLNSSRYSVMPCAHPAISHFYAFDVAQSANLLAVPDGCVDILFDCDATRPTARICGTPLVAQAVELHQHHHYFGVRFSPGVIPGFVNVLAEELTERELDLLEVSEFAQRIFESIVQTPLLGDQMRLFNDYLTPRLMGKTSKLTAMIIQQAMRH